MAVRQEKSASGSCRSTSGLDEAADGCTRPTRHRDQPAARRWCDRSFWALVQIAVTSKKRPVCAMENSSPKHDIPDLRRGLTLNAQTSQSELSFPDAVQ